MKLSVSNLGWDGSRSEEVYDFLIESGVEGLEVAPGKLFENPYEVERAKVIEKGKMLLEKGLRVCSLQAVIFGRPQLQLFAENEDFIVAMKSVMDFAQDIGAGAVVLGAPKNRLIRERGSSEVKERAVSAFRELGEYAKVCGTHILIEPNHRDYGCDFITNTSQAIELVDLVADEGFKLNLDLATITMNEEFDEGLIMDALERAGHVHVSEAFLKEVPQGGTMHEEFANLIKESAYQGWVSLEMNGHAYENSIEVLKESVRFFVNVYGA